MDELSRCENKHCNVSYNACPELMEWYGYPFSKSLCYDCYLDLCIKDIDNLKPVFEVLKNGTPNAFEDKIIDNKAFLYKRSLLLKMIEDTIF